MAYQDLYRRRLDAQDDSSFDDDRAMFWEIATVVLFVVMANWFVHTSSESAKHHDGYCNTGSPTEASLETPKRSGWRPRHDSNMRPMV
jgi:hypothetical protein